jgi:hypothetical protein
MTRHLVAVVLLVLLALPAPAQNVAQPPPATVVVGPPVLGGRYVSGPPITNGASALYPVQMAVPSRFSVGGGSLSAPPQVWVPSGGWGGTYYPWPVYPVEVVSDPVPARPDPGLFPAPYPQATGASALPAPALVVQFPAAAEVWVGGKKLAGEPKTEWTLNPPAQDAGASYTFEVKGRWKTGDKTFEASRSVTVPAGDRPRLIIASGAAVKE